MPDRLEQKKFAYLGTRLYAPNLEACGVSYGFTGRPDLNSLEIVRVRQVHGTHIVNAVNLSAGRNEVDGDGVWAIDGRRKIGVITADCLPVLLSSRDGRIVMALHAGWRGLAAGIIGKGVKLFAERGIAAQDIAVAIGPCICRQHYEVGPEVRAAFASGAIGLSAPQVESAFAPGRDDRWHLDLAHAATLELNNYDVECRQIAVVTQCTYESPEHWFSYRRAKKYEGNNYSWISGR